MMPELVQNGRSHRGERDRQNSSRGGFSEHKVASDLVVHSQDLCIFPTQGGQLRPGQVLSGWIFVQIANLIFTPGCFGARWCHLGIRFCRLVSKK